MGEYNFYMYMADLYNVDLDSIRKIGKTIKKTIENEQRIARTNSKHTTKISKYN